MDQKPREKKGRSPCCAKEGLQKGPWSSKEDALLVAYIQQHGEGQWKSLPQRAGLLRCGKSCRLRWMNYLRPGIKLGNISEDEEDLILRLHRLLGNRWSLIAGRLPGRTDNEIKNYWNTHIVKKKKLKPTTPPSGKPPRSTVRKRRGPSAVKGIKKISKAMEIEEKKVQKTELCAPKARRLSPSFKLVGPLNNLTFANDGGVETSPEYSLSYALSPLIDIRDLAENEVYSDWLDVYRSAEAESLAPSEVNMDIFQ